MQSKCTCKSAEQQLQQRSLHSPSPFPTTLTQSPPSSVGEKESDREPLELCDVCRYHRQLPQLHSMPDMLFNNNLLRLEHSSGVGIEFNPLDALKLVETTKDPLRVAVADGWQSARADCQFARNIVKPFDWTFTTSYRGTLLSAIKKSRPKLNERSQGQENHRSLTVDERSQTENCIDAKCTINETNNTEPCFDERETNRTHDTLPDGLELRQQTKCDDDDRLDLTLEETDKRIDVNKLKVREEILFYDDVTLYEDELADHGTAQYSVKVRVMPSSLFILARYYLRIDGVLARINDTRIYHELSERYILREYTNREAKLSTLNLPVWTFLNPNELVNHLTLIRSEHEKLSLPKLR